MTFNQQQSVLAYVALGSNIDDREAYLKRAVAALYHHVDIKVKACSSIYETEPVGYVEQPPFLNMVISVETKLPALQLLGAMQDIERQLGRTREVRWGPRTIDLDMLLYGEDQVVSEELTIPHPHMDERAFVLIPLAEVLNKHDQTPPGFSEKLDKLEGKEGVRVWKKVQ
jgi:2-amino-4-hydroxy-6-hydroxymethyldihydropteridine diphosphokinase